MILDVSCLINLHCQRNHDFIASKNQVLGNSYAFSTFLLCTFFVRKNIYENFWIEDFLLLQNNRV